MSDKVTEADYQLMIKSHHNVPWDELYVGVGKLQDCISAILRQQDARHEFLIFRLTQDLAWALGDPVKANLRVMFALLERCRSNER